jgi:hypothetical protein
MIRCRYLAQIDIDAMDREPLQSGLEDEPGALHALLPNGRLEEQIEHGRVEVDVTRDEPMAGFPEALASVSAYLSQIVDGFVVAEELDAHGGRVDVQCVRYIARLGDWVAIPLGHTVAFPSGEIRPSREDPRALAKMWGQLPQWAKDGYRQSFPELCELS